MSIRDDFLPLPDEFFTRTADVARPSVTGRDDAGNAVRGWDYVYMGLPCALLPLSEGDRVLFDQPGLSIRHHVIFPPLKNADGTDGALPDIRDRDRIIIDDRVLGVIDAHDEAEAQVILVASCEERVRG